MAVDYLSALNVGSGLNVTQIVDALVDAEKVPQEARIQKQLDERNVSISSLGDVKSDLSVFKGNLDVYMGKTGLITESTNSTAVGITNNGKIAVQPFTHSISVNQLATSHTLAFAGFTADTDPINADSVQVELGTWDSGGTFTPDSNGTSATITIDSTNNTVQSFAAAINAEDIGVKANVVRIDETNYALSFISPTGEARQMRVSALSGGAAFSSLSYTDAAAHAAKQITAGQDADFTLDGLAITRNTNNVDDIVNGVTIELKQETSSAVGVGANYDSVAALENLTNFVTDLNFMINKLTELTYRGSPSGDDAGPLADDNLVKGYLRSFKRMTTTPIPGFQDQTLYLSNFGVMTELDGSISINEDKFNEFFEANPDAFSAVTNTRAISDSNLVQAELSGSLWKTGTYEFDKTGPTTAKLYKLDENNARVDTGDDMVFEGGKFKITSGDARGLALTMLGDGEDANIFIGKSLMQTLQEFTENILVPNNDIDIKIKTYNDDIVEFNEKITELSERMDNQRALYTEQFTAMESSVASFKKTGDLLTNFMDSWRASLKG
jgi:flagellar hook-associated protein 2